jgi:predicted transcriptional regulator
VNVETKKALDFLEKEVRNSSVLLDGEFTTLMFAERINLTESNAYKVLSRRKDIARIGKKKIDGVSSTVWRLK